MQTLNVNINNQQVEAVALVELQKAIDSQLTQQVDINSISPEESGLTINEVRLRLALETLNNLREFINNKLNPQPVQAPLPPQPITPETLPAQDQIPKPQTSQEGEKIVLD